jgi:hypothetical protein
MIPLFFIHFIIFYINKILWFQKNEVIIINFFHKIKIFMILSLLSSMKMNIPKQSLILLNLPSLIYIVLKLKYYIIYHSHLMLFISASISIIILEPILWMFLIFIL